MLLRSNQYLEHGLSVDGGLSQLSGKAPSLLTRAGTSPVDAQTHDKWSSGSSGVLTVLGRRVLMHGLNRGQGSEALKNDARNASLSLP